MPCRLPLSTPAAPLNIFITVVRPNVAGDAENRVLRNVP